MQQQGDVESAQPASVAPTPRVAVLVRGHALDEKYLGLVRDLAGHDLFDTYALFHVMQGEAPGGLPCPVIPYSLGDVEALGFRADSERFVYFCADLLLEHARRSLPEYDYYMMLEYDVDIGSGRGALIDAIVQALTATDAAPFDMVGPELMRMAEGWPNYDIARRHFRKVWAIFMPFIALSRRAVERLYRFRLEEGPPDLPTADRVICEGLASVLMNEPGFRVADLNAVVPGAYDFWRFYYGVPMLAGARPESEPPLLRHPVYAAPAFFERHLNQAWRTHDLRPFIATLSDESLPVAPDLRRRFLALARDRMRWAELKPFRPTARLIDPPPVMLLVDDDDLPVREKGTQSLCLTKVGDRPLVLHVIERLRQAGVQQLFVCPGPTSADVRTLLAQTFAPDRPRVAADPHALAMITGPTPDLRLWLGAVQGSASARWSRCLDLVQDRPVLVVYGNSWSDLDLTALLAAHAKGDRPITLAVSEGCSLTIALDEAARIVSAHRPGLNDLRVETGALVLNPERFARIRRPGSSPRDLLLGAPGWTDACALYTHTGVHRSVNSPREALLLQRLAQQYPESFSRPAQAVAPARRFSVGGPAALTPGGRSRQEGSARTTRRVPTGVRPR